MKKFLIIFSVILSILIGTSFFINSTYFFNKYIATKIQDYGFNYKKVNGALLSGFKIDNLTYKNRALASKAELKFNPIKLLEKKISVSKLRLINVDKDTLDTITRAFKPKDDSSSSTNIDFNFEIKDILLTVKPFKIENADIKKNILRVAYIEYVNSKFNIGKVDYSAQTSLGNIQFDGKYEHKVLNIDKLELKSFNLKQFLPILKTLQNGDSNSTNSDSNMSSPIIPKLVNIKYAKLTLSPFRIKELSAKDLKIELSNAKFDVDKLKLKKAKVNLKYRSDLAKIVSNIAFNKDDLNITNININILNAAKLENIYKKYIDSNSTKSKNETVIPSITNINRIYVDKFNFYLKNYLYKSEKIKSVNLSINHALADIKSKNLKIDNYLAKIHTSTTFAKIDGSLENKLIINNAILNSSNVDKIITLFSNTKKGESNSKTNLVIIKLPNKYIIKNIKIDAKKLSFNPFKINKTLILANNITGDINKTYLNSGNLKIELLSNWGKANLSGNLKNNNYYAKGSYKVFNKLLKEYKIPLNDKNIKPLIVDGRFGIRDLDINIKLSGKDILSSVKNIDILSSKSRLIYKYKSGNLEWDMNANVNTKYTGLAKLKNKLTYNQKLKYSGKLTPKKRLPFAKDLDSLFNNLSLTYDGDSNKIDLAFETDKLKGLLKSKNYSGGILTIKNTKAIKLSELTTLPADYKNSVINSLKIESPIYFKKILPLKGTLAVTSNLINISGKWSYNKNFAAKLLSTMNKKSLIAKSNPNLKLAAISPMNIEIDNQKNLINGKLKGKFILGNISYNLKDNNIDTILTTDSLKVKAKGKLNNHNVDINSKSIKRALRDISRLYKIKKLPDIDGNIEIKANITKTSGIRLMAKSSKIVYYDKKKATKIDNIILNLNYFNKHININSYKFNAEGYNFYSNRVSSILLKKNIINIEKLWINDSLLVTGNYNYLSNIGNLKLKSGNLKIDKPEMKVILAINTDVKINKDKIAINGKIVVINGVIKKNLKNKSISQYNDIIILQRKAADENTDFAKNIKLNLKIKTQQGIVYAQDGSHFKLKPNLKITKEYRQLPIYKGIINIQKGGYYILNGKKLILKKGIVTFKGKSTTPNINIVMIYNGKDYDIRINLSGTPNRPILYFTSNPPLTKDQILAYLLFDDSTAAGTHSQEAMLSLISGTIAKSFLGSIGIKIDHISIKENGFSIGKSISKNVTIYYKQDGEKASVKTRIDISKSIHTEIEVGKDTQSADIIFSKEY